MNKCLTVFPAQHIYIYIYIVIKPEFKKEFHVRNVLNVFWNKLRDIM